MTPADIAALESELARARARYESATNILVEIYAVLSPPVVTLFDGRVMEFQNPMANVMLRSLSDQIRAIPDRLRAIADAEEAKTKGAGE